MSVNAKKFLTPIDLAQNELRKAVIENTAAVPSGGTYVTGQLVSVGTSLVDLYVYSGTSGWAKLTRSGTISSADLAAVSGIALTGSTNIFNNTQTINLTSGANKGLVVIANNTQTGVNVTEWQTSSGTVTTAIGDTGSILAYQGISTGSIKSIASNSVAITVSANQNIQIGSSSTSYGSGQGVIGIANAAVSPTANPTGGGILYVEAGTLKYLGTSGSATVIAYANGAATGGVTSVNGLTGAVTGLATTANTLAQFASTTSAQLASVLSDETGSGAVVFGTSPTLANVTLGTVYSGNIANTTGYLVANLGGLATGVGTFLATPTSANLAAAVTDETGSGSLVFATSPTLANVTLGTVYSGNIANTTGYLVANLGGLGTNISTFLATPTSANFASAITDETGTGSLVFATSPVLANVTLGTVYSANLANATGLPVSTGISGLASGVSTFLANPTSANLASAVTDETGSGSLVFATSPTLANVTLGIVYSGSIANATGYTVDNLANLASGMVTFLKNGTSSSLASALTDEAGNNAVVFSNGASMTNVSINTATFTGTITVPTPTNSTDAANKAYVDNVASGVNAHDAVQAATTAAIVGTYVDGPTIGPDGGYGVGANLTYTATGAQTIDGITLALNDRVLVKNQSIIVTTSSTGTLTNGQPIVVNTASNHGLRVGQTVVIINSTAGNYDGSFIVATTPSNTQFTATGLTYTTGFGFGNPNISGGNSWQNGIYYVSRLGSSGVSMQLTRALDYDNSNAGDAVAGDIVYVASDPLLSTQSGLIFIQNYTGTATTPSKGIKIGTDWINWSQYAGASSTTAGNGLFAVGNSFNVGTSTLAVSTDAVDLATVTFANSTGSTSLTVVHGVTVDTYGRVTGITSGPHTTATSTVAGIALFPTAQFTMTGNSVAISNVSGSIISGAVATATSAVNAVNVTVTESTTSATYYPVFSNSASTGSKGLLQNSGTNAISFNPSTGTLSATVFSGSGGALTGLNLANVSGTLATTAGGLGYSPTLTANTAFYVNGTGTGITNGTLPITAGGTGSTTANTARTALAATGKYTANNIALTMVSNAVSWTISAATHLLGATGGLIVTMKDNSTNSIVEPDIQITETGDVTINWATSANVAANAYRVTIIG